MLEVIVAPVKWGQRVKDRYQAQSHCRGENIVSKATKATAMAVW